MRSHFSNARIAPKKANLVAGIVRGLPVREALSRLQFTPKKAARILLKVIASAMANAKNNFDQKEENLYIKSILVNKGLVLKRGLPISRGRWHPLLKRNSHISVEIGVLAPKKVEMKKETPDPTKKKLETPRKKSLKPKL